MEAPNPSDSDSAAEPRWCLSLSGRAQVVSPRGERHDLERRDAALLALLALDGPMPRARLLDLLWPDDPSERVRNRLRQRIFALKRRLGAQAVVGGPTLALAPGLRLRDDDGAERPLLADDDHADLPEFAQWLAIARERQQVRARERLADEASALEHQGRLAEAIVAAERLLRLEPLQEHAHRRLMRLHYLRGDRAAALLAFDRCERLLKDEIGTRPSAETLELLAQIDSARAVAPATARRVVPASVLRPPRLVGRDAEWARLQSAWQQGDAIVVIGEGGMGKTRLLGDLLRASASGPGRALQVSARPGDERVPYALLGRLLRGVLAQRTAALPQGVAAELARLLPELPLPASASGDAQAAARFIAAIESILRDAVDTGLEAVVLDDLHFADAASLEMAQHLAGLAGLRWLAAFRAAEIGSPGEALVDTLVGRLRAEPIVLRPLTGLQVADLVASLGIAGLDAQPLAQALHQRSGGNPLFLLETVKALLLNGEPGVADAGSLARLPVEGSAARLIERRIGLLSREAVRLARCAAIAGQDFSAGLAARVLDVNPLDLADAWHELESAQVLSDGAFAHDLIFEAARASVPEPIARALHRRIAELMAADGAEPARLAAHWLGAGEDLRAAPHLAEAGRLALRAMRMREGVEYLDRAQAILGRAGNVDAQCALIDELVSPAVMASSFDNIQPLVEQAARNATTDRQRSMTLRSLAALLEQRCEYGRATLVAREALEAALAAGDRACELGARCLLAELLGEQCLGADAEAILRPIEGWVNDQGSGEQRMAYAQALASMLRDNGKLTQSLEHWQRAIDIARDIGAAHALPNLIMTRSINLIYAGRALEGRDAMVEGRRLLHDIPDDAMSLRSFTIRLQVIDRTLGHYTSSLRLGERVLADAGTGPAEIDEVNLARAFAFVDLGQPARVRQLLATPRATTNPFNDLLWHEVDAQCPQPRSQHDQARRLALDAAAGVVGRWTGRSLLIAWRIQARHGDDELAVSAARQGLAFCAASGMRGQQLVFQAWLAQRLARLGETAQAERLAEDSWRLMAEACPGLTYRGVVWQALLDVLEPRESGLARTIAREAADWIARTAADHVPPAFREGFLHRNPANQDLLARVRERAPR